MNKFDIELKIDLRLTEEQYKKLIEVNELMNKSWNKKNTIEETLNIIIGANKSESFISELLDKTKEIYIKK